MALANTSAWVDHATYFGPNRRRGGQSFRFRERRRVDHSGPSPSLNVALRKLRMHVFDAVSVRAVSVFAERVLGVATLAADYDDTDAQVRLQRLAQRILAQPSHDWRQTIYRELDQISIEAYVLH